MWNVGEPKPLYGTFVETFKCGTLMWDLLSVEPLCGTFQALGKNTSLHRLQLLPMFEGSLSLSNGIIAIHYLAKEVNGILVFAGHFKRSPAIAHQMLEGKMALQMILRYFKQGWAKWPRPKTLERP